MARDFLTIDPVRANALARRGSAVLVDRITKRTAVFASVMAPGTMKEKIRPIITGGSNPLGIVMVEHPAATFVLGGTKPHEIRPVNARVLKFEVGGRTVYARLVHHPGTQPNNFLWRALVAARL